MFFPQLVFRNAEIRELFISQLVTPVPKSSLGELHDIALMNQGDTPSSVIQCITNRFAHQALGPENGNRLHANA